VQAPAYPYARLHYGTGLHAVGRHGDAAAQFRACQRLLPEDPAPFLNLASALLALGEARSALDAARRGRRRAPQIPQAHYTEGLALFAWGQGRNEGLNEKSTLLSARNPLYF
jgi:tetratricopeptide (TPR) repeat protein